MPKHHRWSASGFRINVFAANPDFLHYASNMARQKSNPDQAPGKSPGHQAGQPVSYRDAGVNLDVYARSMKRLPALMHRTFTPRVLNNDGGFAGLFGLDSGPGWHKRNYKDPVLVSGTDGVGTKLQLAQKMDRHDTVGIDLVAMCVNDVICCGAEPLFFLDYVAMSHDDPHRLEQIVSGISEGCRQSGCALLGGETAIMPDTYQRGDYDLAGFQVGVVERRKLIDGSAIAVGDLVIGLASSGIHSNGFSLVRKIVFEVAGLQPRTCVTELDSSVGATLLTPTRIYAAAVNSLIQDPATRTRRARDRSHYRWRYSGKSAANPAFVGRSVAGWNDVGHPPGIPVAPATGQCCAGRNVPRIQHGNRHGPGRQSAPDQADWPPPGRRRLPAFFDRRGGRRTRSRSHPSTPNPFDSCCSSAFRLMSGMAVPDWWYRYPALPLSPSSRCIRALRGWRPDPGNAGPLRGRHSRTAFVGRIRGPHWWAAFHWPCGISCMAPGYPGPVGASRTDLSRSGPCVPIRFLRKRHWADVTVR